MGIDKQISIQTDGHVNTMTRPGLRARAKWKYCKRDIWLSCRHTDGSAFSSTASFSRQGSALRGTWIGVLICCQLDLQVLMAGLWGKSYGRWMGSVWGTKNKREKGFTSVMSVTKLSSLYQCLSSTKFGSRVAMCLPATVVTRSSTTKTALTDTISLYGASLTTGQGPSLRRSSSIWTCGGRRIGRGGFWPGPGRGQTSSTLSNGNLLCWFLINLFV